MARSIDSCDSSWKLRRPFEQASQASRLCVSSARAAGSWPRSPATSSATRRSCSSKIASRAPSTRGLWTTRPVAASVTRAVTRMRSPRIWYPPLTTPFAPTSRPSRTARAGSSASAGSPIARRASRIRSRETTARPLTAASPALTVSARPVPSHASSGRPVMFAKPVTATAWPRPAARGGAAPARRASRASTTSGIPDGRRAGSFSSMRATSAKSEAASGPSAEGGGGSRVRMASTSSTALRPSKGRRPASIS